MSTERYISKVEYINGTVKVYLDNGDTLGFLTYVDASQKEQTFSTVTIEAYMVKCE